MSEEPSLPNKAAGLIPHFWFDIIGRIVPGAFLLVGLFSEDWYTSLTEFVHKFAADFPLTSHSVGFFLLFTSAAFFVGHFLGVLSYYFPASVLNFIWPLNGPPDLPRDVQLPLPLASYIKNIGLARDQSEDPHPKDWQKLKELWHKLDARVTTDKIIARRGDILSHWLWTREPQLAMLVSRWAADSLAGRSVAVVSLALAVLKWSHLSGNTKWFLILLSLCGAQTYVYYRRKVASSAVYLSAMFTAEPAGEQPRGTSVSS